MLDLDPISTRSDTPRHQSLVVDLPPKTLLVLTASAGDLGENYEEEVLPASVDPPQPAETCNYCRRMSPAPQQRCPKSRTNLKLQQAGPILRNLTSAQNQNRFSMTRAQCPSSNKIITPV